MTPTFSRRSALIAAVLLALAGATALAGTATAQNAPNATNATVGVSTPEPSTEGSVGPIDVLDYRLKDGTFVLDLRVHESTPYALSDALAGTRTEGVTSVPVKQGALREGKTTLRLSVAVIDGAGAVTLSTPSEAVRIQSEALNGGRPPIPFSSAALGIVVAGVGSGWYSYKRGKESIEESEDPEVNRVA